MYVSRYPKHDINKVFDTLEQSIMAGGCHNDSISEMMFLNKLFAALPPQAVEYGMMFLHGETNLPASCNDILPLYIRFKSLCEYCSKLDYLKDIPASITMDQINERQKVMSSLDDHEKAFLKPLLDFKFNTEGGALEANEEEATNENASESGSALHLMNAAASIFVCKDPLATSLFYETKCGFKAVHLSDESMPHIRLTRDNICIILCPGEGVAAEPLRNHTAIKYDFYIYASEPFMLQNELKNNCVTITEELPEAESAVKAETNRQFVFEDVDGRHICVSQSLEEL
ncbi:MAG: hypothetical protein MJ108_03200 [Saccharofermentans sp.]|nr:hypothetical protein [Saccharofermentans sp.]